jgi:hypothetical protein
VTAIEGVPRPAPITTRFAAGRIAVRGFGKKDRAGLMTRRRSAVRRSLAVERHDAHFATREDPASEPAADGARCNESFRRVLGLAGLALDP